MIKKSYITGVVLLLALFTGLFTACQQSLEPVQTVRLELRNGYYQKTAETAEHVTYNVSFDYMVTGTECIVGGYAIAWCDSIHGQMNWYLAQTIQPNKVYTAHSHHYCPPGVPVKPVITMQGYQQGVYETDPQLRDTLVLRKKQAN